MNIFYRAIRQRRRFINVAGIVNSLYNDVQDIAEEHIQKRFDAILENWSSDVQAEVRAILSNDSIKIDFEIKGTDRAVWFYVSHGTEPHTIEGNPYLHFFWGGPGSYDPKTTPEGKIDGSGFSSGLLFSTVSVEHPGIEPRRFEVKIRIEAQDDVRREIENAFRRAIRRHAV